MLRKFSLHLNITQFTVLNYSAMHDNRCTKFLEFYLLEVMVF